MDSTKTDRKLAVLQLMNVPGDAATATLGAALADEREDVRIAAANALLHRAKNLDDAQAAGYLMAQSAFPDHLGFNFPTTPTSEGLQLNERHSLRPSQSDAAALQIISERIGSKSITDLVRYAISLTAMILAKTQDEETAEES